MSIISRDLLNTNASDNLFIYDVLYYSKLKLKIL